jgi:hypothetical protein
LQEWSFTPNHPRKAIYVVLPHYSSLPLNLQLPYENTSTLDYYYYPDTRAIQYTAAGY